MRAGRGGPGKRQRISTIWHDTAEATLAREGIALAEEQHGRSRRWRLERLWPDGTDLWPPGVAPPVLGEAAQADALGRPFPGPLRTKATFRATSRSATAGAGADAVALTLLEGRLLTGGTERELALLSLAGEPAAVFALAERLIAELPLALAARSLAAEAMTMEMGDTLPSTGPLLLPADLTAGDAAAWMIAALARTLLAWAAQVGAAEAMEPVHQMRVAMRRLRTAIGLLRPVLAAPGPLDAAGEALRALGRILGPAREWDVFLAGPGVAIGAAFADDAGIRRLLAAARRRRETCYAALARHLESAEYRGLILRLSALAMLRPWQEAAEEQAEPAFQVPIATLAPALLARRYRRLLAAGNEITTADAAALHKIRLRAKRLRYTAEILSGFFPGKATRRFLRQLVRLQDRLGALNDAAAVERLLAELGAAGHGRAGGIVLGFVAAGALAVGAPVEAAWRKLRKRQPFWE